MAETIVSHCAVCQKEATQKCGSCHGVYYCCREHQKADWKNHKKVCRPFKVTIKNFNMMHPTYQCVTVIRCLYQKQFLPETWKKIDELQSHCEERKDTQKYEQEKINIAQFVRKFFKLESVFTDEEILKVCGIVMVRVLFYQ
nr:unnamed protein product [Callosobruchus analis]